MISPWPHSLPPRRRPVLLFVLSCLMANLCPTIAHVAFSLDQQVFLFFNRDHGLPWLDSGWAVLSSLDFWMPFLILTGVLIAWFGGFRGRAMLACLLLSIGLMEGCLINPLKDIIGRQRPSHVLPQARRVDLAQASPRLLALAEPARVRPSKASAPRSRGNSLPSGHTSNMFCFATVLAIFYRWRGALFYIPASLVALSRIATGSHWPSDIVLSAIMSVLVTYGLVALYRWIWHRWAPGIVPKLASRHPRLIPPQ